MDREIANAIEALRHDFETRMAAMDLSLGTRITTIETTLRKEMHEMRDELSRNAAILTQSVRDDIRIVAEGLAVVSAKIDALRG